MKKICEFFFVNVVLCAQLCILRLFRNPIIGQYFYLQKCYSIYSYRIPYKRTNDKNYDEFPFQVACTVRLLMIYSCYLNNL